MRTFTYILFFFLSCIALQARVVVKCDVIYEKEKGKWSDYQRTNVEFMYGSEISDNLMKTNSLYAVIWFSQTECTVIEMDYNTVSIGAVDQFFIFTFLGGDILNEGREGVQTNDTSNRKWRIYGKDENSFLIDPMFSVGSYNSYNEGVQRNINNGFETKRQRPKEESLYEGLVRGEIKYISPNEWYIVQTEDFFVGVERNKIYMFYGSVDIGDIVYADFHTKGKTSISNATKGTTHHYVVVKCLFNNYQDCYSWMNQHVE